MVDYAFMSQSVAVGPTDIDGRLAADLFGVALVGCITMALVGVVEVWAAALVSAVAMALAGLVVIRLRGHVTLTASESAYVRRRIRPPTTFGCGERGIVSMRRRMSKYPTTRIHAGRWSRISVRADISVVTEAMSRIGYEFVDRTGDEPVLPKLVASYQKAAVSP